MARLFAAKKNGGEDPDRIQTLSSRDTSDGTTSSSSASRPPEEEPRGKGVSMRVVLRDSDAGVEATARPFQRKSNTPKKSRSAHDTDNGNSSWDLGESRREGPPSKDAMRIIEPFVTKRKGSWLRRAAVDDVTPSQSMTSFDSSIKNSTNPITVKLTKGDGRGWLRGMSKKPHRTFKKTPAARQEKWMECVLQAIREAKYSRVLSDASSEVDVSKPSSEPEVEDEDEIKNVATKSMRHVESEDQMNRKGPKPTQNCSNEPEERKTKLPSPKAVEMPRQRSAKREFRELKASRSEGGEDEANDDVSSVLSNPEDVSESYNSFFRQKQRLDRTEIPAPERRLSTYDDEQSVSSLEFLFNWITCSGKMVMVADDSKLDPRGMVITQEDIRKFRASECGDYPQQDRRRKERSRRYRR